MTLSMGSVKSAGGAANYFAKDNYYTAEQAELASQWGGEGSREAGLKGPVDQKRFEDVLNGLLPGGTQVGDPETRANGSDFTFSAPKSLSLLAYLSGDKRLLAANMEAVKATMAWAEKNLAEGRIKVDGTDTPVRTGNLVYALFPHDTSRALDPQAHIHAVIANLTRLPEKYRNPDKTLADGTVVVDDGWRALRERPLWKANTTLGSIYHAALRERVEALGYATELTGKHGAFEISGIDRTALEAFSKRRQEITTKAEELGIKVGRGLLAIALRTRDPKLDAGDREVMAQRWREEGRAVGYNGDEVMARALERSGERPVRGAIAVRDAIGDAIGRFADVLRGGAGDLLVDQGLARLTRTPETARAQYATASAIRILAERETAFRRSDIVKTALDLGLKGVTHERVEARLVQLTERGELVNERSQRHDSAIDVVTTRGAIAAETKIIQGMDAGAGAARPLMRADVAADRLQALAGDRQLNEQQLAAAVQVVSSADRIVLVQGRAGAGKSTMLQPIARAEALDATARLLAAEGKDPILLTAETRAGATGDALALAFQNKMVADLKESTGLEAMTVHSFIARTEPLLEKGANRAALAERRAELARFYRPERGDLIVNMWDQRTVRWTLIDDIRSLADAHRVAAVLLPKPSNAGESGFWYDQARLLLAHILHHLVRTGGTLDDLAELLNGDPDDQDNARLRAIVAGTPAARVFAAGGERATASVLLMAGLAARTIYTLASVPSDAPAFSFDQFIATIDDRDGPRPFLFLSVPRRYRDLGTPVVTACIDAVASAILQRTPNKGSQVWTVIDELPTLPPIQSLNNILPEGRKYRVSVTIAFQSLAQLHASYGEAAATVITGQTGTQLIMGLGDTPTAKWASELVGVTEGETMRPTITMDTKAKGDRGSLSPQRERHALVMDSELTGLATGEAFLRLAGRPVARLRLPAPRDEEEIAPAFVEAPDTADRIEAAQAATAPAPGEDGDDWLPPVRAG